MAQMFDHTLNIVKGWPSQTAIDWSAPVASANAIVAGRVISLTSDGEWQLGLASTYAIPYFARNAYNDYDAIGDTISDTSSVGFTGTPTSVTSIDANVTGLCITNGYHAQSTEWTGTASAFVPNAPLKSSATGVIEVNNNVATYPVIGYVNRGIVTNEYGKEVVDFLMKWTPIHS
jgi:hypothetical protein